MNIFKSLMVAAFFMSSMLLSAQDYALPKELKGFEKYVQKTLKDFDVPGMAVAIVKGDKVIYANGFGYRNMEDKAPVTKETIFAIGSSTKAFTATAVCMLDAEGEIDMNEPVRKYMPSFKLDDECISANITPKDLLIHNSGLPRHDLAWYGSSKSRSELVESMQYMEITQPFRSTFQYQNLMYMAAGSLIEEVTGLTWEKFIDKNLFQPLKMDASFLSVDQMNDHQNAALAYEMKNDKLQSVPYRNLDAVAPAGAINSNILDMTHWVIANLNGGKFQGEQVIPAACIQKAHTPYMVLSSSRTGVEKDVTFYFTYGLGWFINFYQGHLMVEHGGNIDGFSADVALYPEDSLGIVILSNASGTVAPYAVRNYIADRLLGEEKIDWNKRYLDKLSDIKKATEEAKPAKDDLRVKGTSPSHPLKDYAGKYEDKAYGKFTVTERNDSLFGSYNTFDFYLSHYHYDIFNAVEVGEADEDGIKVKFETNLEGEISNLVVNMPAGGNKPVDFKRVIEAKELSSSELEKYEGNFEIAGMKVKVEVLNDQLTMTVPGQPQYTLIALGDDKFQLKGLDGYRAGFTVEGGKALELVMYQPNGTFKAKRVE